jgi:hypothetical protein
MPSGRQFSVGPKPTTDHWPALVNEEYSRAIEDYTQAIRIRPQEPSPHRYRASGYHLIGESNPEIKGSEWSHPP